MEGTVAMYDFSRVVYTKVGKSRELQGQPTTFVSQGCPLVVVGFLDGETGNPSTLKPASSSWIMSSVETSCLSHFPDRLWAPAP